MKSRLIILSVCLWGLVGALRIAAAAQDPNQPPATPTNLFYILSPDKQNALTVSTNALLEATNGTVYVFSRHPKAVLINSGGAITVKGIALLGGAEVPDQSKVKVGERPPAPEPRDPLAQIPAPDPAGMPSHGKAEVTGKGKTATLSPGIYDSIKVTFEARVLMRPGVYMIKEGFEVGLGAMVSGQEVFIYDAGKFAVGTNGQLALTAPKEGAYKDLALYMTRGNKEAVWLSSSGIVNIKGTIYIPTGQLWVTTNCQTTVTHIVADNVRLDANGKLVLK